MSTAVQPLSEARIAAYLRGELSEEERAAVEAAMDAEPHWLGVLALLAAELEAPASESADSDGSTVERVHRQFSSRLHPGQRVGRFEIERPLGRGGMGSVYAAFDPELERTVALKILHASRPEEQPRLLAEARALAQVNHPNVITVHDVGRWNERVFVAMELLDGRTLREWRAGGKRTWEEVVDAHVDAGLGLAAAHAAGIVHRDVKPSNVMITAEGRVVVVDFGLAVDVGPAQDTPDSDDVSARNTHRAGTPAYMAPEQRRGEQATPASDEFGLSVSLFEALTGTLPEASGEPLRRAGFEACVRIPRRVMRVVQRGLSVRGEDRYGSTEAFVEALRRASNTPLWPLGVGVVGLLAGLVLLPAGSQDETCSGAEDALAQVWTPQRRAELDAALRSPSGAWSDGVADAVLQRLDVYTSAWLAERDAACEAEGEGDERLGARMLCLDRRLRQLDALLDVLERGELEIVSNATQAVDALPSVEQCRDASSLSDADGTRDPEAEALRDRLAYASALRESAVLEDAQREVRSALAAIVARHDEWLEADARLVLGWVLHDLGDHDASEEQLRLAVSLGTVARNDRVVGTGLDRLAWVVGYKLGRYSEGLELADRAESWSARLEGGDALAAYRETTRGWIEHDAGRPDVALAHFRRAAEVARAASPSDLEATYDLGLALNGLGSAQLSLGELEAAAETFERAESLLTARLGAEHPRVAQVMNNRASVLRGLARPAEALEAFQRTRAVFIEVYGPDHMTVGQTAANLAIVLHDLGRYEDGFAQANDALRILTPVVGEQHPLVAKCLSLRGDARIGLGEYEDGLRDLHRALAMEIELLGPEHPSVGISQSNLSIVYDKLGRLEDAINHQELALEILIAAHGESHDFVGVGQMNLAFLERKRGNYERSLELYRSASERVSEISRGMVSLGLGEAYLLVDRPDEAARVLEDVVAFLEGQPPSLGSRGEGLFLLAQARWEQGRAEEARALAAEAIVALEAEEEVELKAEVEAWSKAPRPFTFTADG